MHEADEPAGRALGIVRNAVSLDQRGQDAGSQLMHMSLAGDVDRYTGRGNVKNRAVWWAQVVSGAAMLLLAVALRLSGRPLNVGLLAFGSMLVIVGAAWLVRPPGGPGPKPPPN